ncbi:hypothetical protein COM43_001620, partial [Wolbachia pipientis]
MPSSCHSSVKHCRLGWKPASRAGMTDASSPFGVIPVWDPEKLIVHYTTFSIKPVSATCMTSSATHLDYKRRILKQQVSGKSYAKSSIYRNYIIFMHSMVFIINGECDMALNDDLNGRKVQDLINDDTFITALVPKLTAGAGVNGVYTKKGVDDELKKKADTAALTNKADKNYVDTELGKKADTSALDNKANTTDVYTKTDANTAFVKTADLKTKAAEKDVVEAIFDAKDGNDKISETKIGATFAKKTDLNNKVNV